MGRCKIKDEKSDAFEIIKRIKKQERALRESIAELEFLIYECDERCEIKFLERRVRNSK